LATQNKIVTLTEKKKEYFLEIKDFHQSVCSKVRLVYEKNLYEILVKISFILETLLNIKL
jgi:hypothetical protein